MTGFAGGGTNEVPTCADLGTMAFQNAENCRVGILQTDAFGCNGKAPQQAVAVNGPCTDSASAQVLLNQLRAALAAIGIVS